MKKFIKHIVIKILLVLAVIQSYSIAQQKDSVENKKREHNQLSLIQLRERLDEYLSDHNFSSANWGVLVKSLTTGEIIYKKNPDKLFIPASNIKLFTTAAALQLLGPNYVYSTSVFGNGIIKDGKLEGDLIIQGSGDPTISTRFYSGSSTKIFEDWADSLLVKGIKEISGNIYGDDALFDITELGKGWSWEYESSWFSAPTGALCFNDNSIMVTIKPSKTGLPADILLTPETNFVITSEKVITVDNKSEELVSIQRVNGTNKINISGKVHKDSQPIVEYVSISDPTKFFLTVLKETFERKGIKINGTVASIDAANKVIIPENLLPLFEHESVPLYLIIKEVNKNSNNFYAEQILKTIGLEINNYGSTKNGIKAVRDLFYSMGINPEQLVMVDGSGLSRLNLVTPRQIVSLLSFMYSEKESKLFLESLPIGGIDGTISNRFKKISLEENLRAKAGFLDNLSALSGYIKTISGETLAFSIIVNNFLVPLHLVHFIEESICTTLVNFTRN